MLQPAPKSILVGVVLAGSIVSTQLQLARSQQQPNKLNVAKKALKGIPGAQKLALKPNAPEKILVVHGKVRANVVIPQVVAVLVSQFPPKNGWTVYWEGLVYSPKKSTKGHKNINNTRVQLIQEAIGQIPGAQYVKLNKVDLKNKNVFVGGQVRAPQTEVGVKKILLDAFRPSEGWTVFWFGVLKK